MLHISLDMAHAIMRYQGHAVCFSKVHLCSFQVLCLGLDCSMELQGAISAINPDDVLLKHDQLPLFQAVKHDEPISENIVAILKIDIILTLASPWMMMQENDKAKIPTNRLSLENVLATTETRLARLRQLQPAFIKWEALRDKHLPEGHQHISELQRNAEAQSAAVETLQEGFNQLERQLQVLELSNSCSCDSCLHVSHCHKFVKSSEDPEPALWQSLAIFPIGRPACVWRCSISFLLLQQEGQVQLAGRPGQQLQCARSSDWRSKSGPAALQNQTGISCQ